MSWEEWCAELIESLTGRMALAVPSVNVARMRGDLLRRRRVAARRDRRRQARLGV